MAKKKAKKAKSELRKASDTFLAVLKAEQKALLKEQTKLEKLLEGQNPIQKRLDIVNNTLDNISETISNLGWNNF